MKRGKTKTASKTRREKSQIVTRSPQKGPINKKEVQLKKKKSSLIEGFSPERTKEKCKRVGETSEQNKRKEAVSSCNRCTSRCHRMFFSNFKFVPIPFHSNVKKRLSFFSFLLRYSVADLIHLKKKKR